MQFLSKYNIYVYIPILELYHSPHVYLTKYYFFSERERDAVSNVNVFDGH